MGGFGSLALLSVCIGSLIAAGVLDWLDKRPTKRSR